jgi:hypothetical protein
VLRSLFLDGIANTLSNNTNLDPDKCDPALTLLITQQNQLGWTSLFFGLISTHWSTCQDKYLSFICERSNSKNGQTWAVSTVEFLWHACNTLWESHNKRVHGNNPQEAERLLKQKLTTKICFLHNRRSECMPDSTKLFHPQLSTFLLKSTFVQLQNWLNLYGPAIIDSIETRKSESVLNTRPLTKYFKTTSATSTRPSSTRHRRTLKPRFASTVRFMLPRILNQNADYHQFDIPHGLLDGLLQTKSSHSFLLSNSSNLDPPTQTTPGSGPAVQAVRCASQVTFLCYDP